MAIAVNGKQYELVFAREAMCHLPGDCSATDRAVLYAYGENRVVWIDPVTGKPQALLEAVRERLLTPLTSD